MKSENLFKEISSILEENKAINLFTVDLTDKAGIADYVIVATGTSNKHNSTLADKIITQLKKLANKNIRVDGMEFSNWIALDAGNIVVHIFLEEVRDYYNIERIWK